MDEQFSRRYANVPSDGGEFATASGHAKGWTRRSGDRRAAVTIHIVSELPVAAFCCDLHGAVVSHNEAAAQLWGREPIPRSPGSGAVPMPC